MLCPKCSKEIPPAFTLCPFCAQTALNGDPLSAAPTSLPPPKKEAPAAPKILCVIGGMVCIILIVWLCAALARKTYPVMNAEGVGYAFGSGIGVFLLPAIGVLIYAKANKKKHEPAYLFGATCGIALLWSFLGIVPQLIKQKTYSQEEINQRVAQLAKEGLGQVPKGKNQDEADDVLRAFFADIKKFNDDYNAEIAANDTSGMKGLYSADSFSSDAKISLALQQLRATLAIDEKFASIEPIINKTKERLRASSISEDWKAGFQNGFEGSLKKTLGPRDEAIAKERLWLNDSIDLYEFMKENEKSFYVKGGKIVFRSDDALDNYNEQVDKVEAERKEFLAAQNKFHEAQKEGLGKLGLKPSDFHTPGQK